MGYPLNEEFIIKYEYDFEKDGGAISEIALRPDINALGEGVVVKDITLVVQTALDSGGTPTVTLGNSTDPDGYMADIWALAQSDNAVVNAGAVAGALIWDDTNDHAIQYRIDGTAANQDLVLDVGTAPLTAGKIDIFLRCSYAA